MKFIKDSAEHHFVTKLEKIKLAPEGWATVYFPLSRSLEHKDLVSDPAQMQARILKTRAAAESFATGLVAKSEAIREGFVYLFSDCDVLMLAQVLNDGEAGVLAAAQKESAGAFRAEYSAPGALASEYYNYQKLADKKLLAAKCFEAYSAMGDANKVSSISVRRSRRDKSKVLIVEDDRFTASYTAGILSKEYELSVCRTGEEGIISYIEHAPDIVFLDIHLPGLSGHDTLAAIRAIDPKAFVVMLSVDTARDNIVQASQTGAQNFLKKPFSKERLLHAVKSSPYVRGHDGSVH